MERWFYVEEGGGSGCLGCLGLAVGLFLLSWLCSFSSLIHNWYTDRQIENQRVEVPTTLLDKREGKYNYNGRYEIHVERRGRDLYTKSPDAFCRLLPLSTDEFIFRNCSSGFQGRARFVDDARGGATLIILYRDGREDYARRVRR